MSQLSDPPRDVHVVELHHLVERHVVAAGDLPQAGDARRDVEALLGPAAAAGRFVDPERPWADQAHLAAQHVEELGHLVEAPLAQHGAHPGEPRVAPDLEHRSRVLVLVGEIVAQLLRIQVHRAQLENAKHPPAAAHALLRKEHRPPRVELDGQRKQPDERQGDHGQNGAGEQVEEPA